MLIWFHFKSFKPFSASVCAACIRLCVMIYSSSVVERCVHISLKSCLKFRNLAESIAENSGVRLLENSPTSDFWLNKELINAVLLLEMNVCFYNKGRGNLKIVDISHSNLQKNKIKFYQLQI